MRVLVGCPPLLAGRGVSCGCSSADDDPRNEQIPEQGALEGDVRGAVEDLEDSVDSGAAALSFVVAGASSLLASFWL